MSSSFDTIVIGAGHNGLVAACYLARAGQKVLVLESRSVVGGAASTEETFPGFRMNVGADHAQLFRKEILDDLDLPREGLVLKPSPAILYGLNPDGPPLTIHTDPSRTERSLAAHSKKDSERYGAFCQFFSRMTRMLRETTTRKPLDPMQVDSASLREWAPVAWKLWRMGRRDMSEFLRILPMPVRDFLDEWFENDFVKGTLGSGAVTGGQFGPRAAGTTYMLMYQNMGVDLAGFAPPVVVQGGMGALSSALAKKASSLGATIRMDAGVSRIRVSRGAVTGVICTNGDKISAKRVVSCADPYRTFFELLGPERLGLRFVRAVRNIKFKGTTAKLNLALKSLPRFEGDPAPSPEDLTGAIVLSPSLDYLEKASDDAKYGRYSAKPSLHITLPTLLDPTLAPEGQHVMSIRMQFAPFRLRDSSWEEKRDELASHILAAIRPHCPGIEGQILHQEMLTPLDLQTRLGLREGSIHHGQMGLDQLLFMRPVPGHGSYRTPIEGLFLCGAGSHPGGGVTGAPGYNAAKTILKTEIRPATHPRKHPTQA